MAICKKIEAYAVDAIDQSSFAMNGALIKDASHCTTQMTGQGTAQNAHPPGRSHTPPLPGAGEYPIEVELTYFSMGPVPDLLMGSNVQRPGEWSKGLSETGIRCVSRAGTTTTSRFSRIRGREGLLQILGQGLPFSGYCETHRKPIDPLDARFHRPDTPPGLRLRLSQPLLVVRTQHSLNNSTISSIFRKFSLSLLLYKNFLNTGEIV
jgi:hypothetical protein